LRGGALALFHNDECFYQWRDAGHRLREAGLNAQQLSDIARYDVVNGDNSADSMISAANPSAAVMAKVMVAFRQWRAVVDRYREPQLHGSALTAARGEFRDCNIQ
jgi:hypothetical protein